MNQLIPQATTGTDEAVILAPSAQTPFALSAVLGGESSHHLRRMFRDPRVLDSHERGDLIAQLRQAVALAPEVAEVRVLLGMALCVDLQAQEALEELREATRLSPDCFVARLKFGELLMRLRICNQAAEETQRAAELAANDMQAELARKQAATIRTMLREGIERGGYGGFMARILGSRFSRNKSTVPALVASK